MINYQLSLENLHILAEEISKNFQNGVIILKGNLASGKTTFVKALALELDIKDDVTSPTFSLQQCYGDRLFHYDIYNHGIEHFISLGMLEELEKDGIHLVEWGDDRLRDILSSASIKTITISISKSQDDIREYEVDYAHA